MRVLVVGGAGYIGSVMVARLLDSGYEPVVLDDFSTGKPEALPPGIRLFKGDMGDTRLLDSILSSGDIQVVMHFAAKIAVGESVERPDFYYSNNVVKTIALLDAMVRNRVDKFIFSSTAAVYGEPHYLPIDEKHPTNPINPYGRSKRMVEQILWDYGKAFGLRYVILRYFNAAGASLDGTKGESQRIKQNLIPIVLENLEKGRASTIFGDDWPTPDGTCIRDFIHVEDIVSAHKGAIDLLMNGVKADIFNLGTEKGSSVKEVIDAVVRSGGKEILTQVGPRREGDPAEVIASNGKAKAVLNWEPQRSSLDSIVRSAFKWHFNRRY